MLVVSKICAGGYGAGRARERSARGQERVVGRSAAGAAVGVAEENPVVVQVPMNPDNPLNPMNQADPRNPASPMNQGVYGLPFVPLR